ncbi:hypothetical protein [Streptomyces sp. NPDC048551]
MEIVRQHRAALEEQRMRRQEQADEPAECPLGETNCVNGMHPTIGW